MLTARHRRMHDALTEAPLWTNVYGVARTLLALGTATTLAVNSSATLFRSGGTIGAVNCRGITALSPFCLVPTTWLDLARWSAVLALLAVASGWFPRRTGFIHWWISWGFFWSANGISDGGDKITAVLALFLIPITLTDRRPWHWQYDRRNSCGQETSRIIFLTALLLIRVQVALLYLDAVLGKLGVSVWRDGTALYYIVQDPTFGAPSWLAPYVNALVMSRPALLLLTWGSVAVELCLSAAYLLPATYRRPMLIVGAGFHFAIAIIMGVVSFSIAMVAALILYLRSPEHLFFLRAARN
jgi:sporulation delaying protein B